jgi:hypothetical protein
VAPEPVTVLAPLPEVTVPVAGPEPVTVPLVAVLPALPAL